MHVFTLPNMYAAGVVCYNKENNRETGRFVMIADYCVELRWQEHLAWVCPSLGANCVRLRHRGAELLRTPAKLDELAESPCLYGTPLLVPPNRIADGRFEWNGRDYRLEINEPSRNNHIHGFVMNAPFRTAGRRTTRQSDAVTLRYDASADRRYADQGLSFSLEVTYALSGAGLEQTIRIVNGENPLPLGLGQHTALRAPFRSGERPEDVRLRVPAAAEWTLERERVLPTGERGDTPLCHALREGRVAPCAQPVSALITLNGTWLELFGAASGSTVRYRMDGYPFVMLWNQNGSRGFICCEPQTWVTNAPNLLALPPRETGFIPLLPHERRTLRTSLGMAEKPKNTSEERI